MLFLFIIFVQLAYHIVCDVQIFLGIENVVVARVAENGLIVFGLVVLLEEGLHLVLQFLVKTFLVIHQRFGQLGIQVLQVFLLSVQFLSLHLGLVSRQQPLLLAGLHVSVVGAQLVLFGGQLCAGCILLFQQLLIQILGIGIFCQKGVHIHIGYFGGSVHHFVLRFAVHNHALGFYLNLFLWFAGKVENVEHNYSYCEYAYQNVGNVFHFVYLVFFISCSVPFCLVSARRIFLGRAWPCCPIRGCWGIGRPW